jgi:serine/threonine protein phosphatase PrpC
MDKFYIPKNVVTKYAFATRVGYIPMNPSKVNQDTYILGPCIEGPENNSKHMFGVNDGHGQFGHHASGFIKEALLEIVKELIEKDKNNQPKDQSMIAKEYEDLFQSAFLKCDQRLSDASEKSREQESEIDFFDLRLSGSTVCTVFFDGTSVHCANAGDSRAIKVKLAYDENDKLQTVCEALSEDHKPDLAAEKARILGMGGRIDTFHDT